VLQQGTTT
jgi:hypothetical protein